jgi:hypothetical protein
VLCFCAINKEFEDTKGVIRIHIPKKNRQHNDQKKKYKRTNSDLQNIHIKLKMGRQEKLIASNMLVKHVHDGVLNVYI